MKFYYVESKELGKRIKVSAKGPQDAIKVALKTNEIEIVPSSKGDSYSNFEVMLADSENVTRHVVNYYFVKKKVSKFDKMLSSLQSIVKDMAKSKNPSTTYRLSLGVDEERNDWAIVLAWQDGFENEKDSDFILEGGYRICGKIAYKQGNSMLSEYDMDWVMPYNKKTGEVEDTELSIVSFEELESDLRWWLKEYSWFKKKYNIKDIKGYWN